VSSKTNSYGEGQGFERSSPEPRLLVGLIYRASMKQGSHLRFRRLYDTRGRLIRHQMTA
jgi:hypothetical protein